MDELGLLFMLTRDNIAVCLLAMMYPILCKVKFETLHLVFQKKDIWVQIGFSLVVNWIVAPLLMVFMPLLPSLDPGTKQLMRACI